jgi:hypothetical protein
MIRELKTTVHERIVRPVAGRIVGRGNLVGAVLGFGPVVAAVGLVLAQVSLQSPLDVALAAVGFGSVLLGLEVSGRASKKRCPACRGVVDSEENYCGRCSTDITTVPTELERVAEGTTDRKRLVEREQIDGELKRWHESDAMLVAEERGGEVVLHRVDPEVWESITDSEPVEVRG